MENTGIEFKYKHLTEEGNETGFMAKKGKLDDENLTLDKEEYPVKAFLKAERRFDRLILSTVDENSELIYISIAIKKGDLKAILKNINRITSKNIAENRREVLIKEGRGELCGSHECPHCQATIDLNGFPKTKQVYCDYCETIISLDGHAAANENQYTICESCGFFSQPKQFSTFYFYFLFVIWGYSHSKKYFCSACMRGEAWKMFFSNFIFVLGLPFSIVQLFRAYLGDKGDPAKTYAGLDKANLLAGSGKNQEALQAYMKISQNLHDSAGIRYNCAMSFLASDDYENASSQLESSLGLCSNYDPSFQLLYGCYDKLGQSEKMKTLKEIWGIKEDAELGSDGDKESDWAPEAVV
jgi:tetratricopeptide (TPR) repeat protein